YRLDYKFSRLLAREAEREPAVYAPFYFQDETWRARDLRKIKPREVYAQSPLLEDKPDFIRLHFQVDARGRFSSPQVPTGHFLEVAEQRQVAADLIPANAGELQRIQSLVDPADLGAKLAQAEKQTAALQARPSKRAQVAATVKKGLEPIWQGGELVFLRRVRMDDQALVQGFVVDWPRLHAILVKEIEDLFPDATLRPVTDDTTDRRLFTLPVALEAPRPASTARSRWTATHTVLAITWVVFLLAFGAVGYALRKSIEFGQRQRRFASLVTHELRSPLTTFRLYADLLAEGLVKEEGKREVYHRTLQRESDQMTRMVENVIAHSRLEEGRARLDRRRIPAGALLEEVAGDLERCARESGLTFSLDTAAVHDVALETDPAAVGQILQNLVENACKYGRSDERPAIHVGGSVREGTLRLFVRDHGPGVAPAVASRIFRPFERGARDETDPARGLGLGLALSRGLARDLGGDLTLEPPADGGACFVLTLPVAR
ncbi:MAG: sensor histidine kinase, partial [Planctomycetota bacterium]